MHLYLSSLHIGDRSADLQRLARGRTLGFVPNAIDGEEPVERAASNARRMAQLTDLGIDAVELDLRRYFGDTARLSRDMGRLGGVWVRGGNTFVLRQAMRLSGFDTLIRDRVPTDFLYGGYSAGICILAPRLEGLHHTDDPTLCPYPGGEVIWEGLGILDHLILPHFESDAADAATVDTDVAYCVAHGIAFRTLRDGEVLIEEITCPLTSSRY